MIAAIVKEVLVHIFSPKKWKWEE